MVLRLLQRTTIIKSTRLTIELLFVHSEKYDCVYEKEPLFRLEINVHVFDGKEK
jgi:hypothetical protein